MAEKLNNSTVESTKELERLQEAGAERSAELERKLEQDAEKSKAETSVESARDKAMELAHEKVEQEPAEKPESAEVKTTLRPTKKQRDDNFNRSMGAIRKDMKPASRAFSKVIHNPAVEKISDVAANTIARPNLIIAGGLGTLIFCSAIYLVAKNYGYVLSGFEAIGTFILGWSIGAIIEFARVGFINQKNR